MKKLLLLSSIFFSNNSSFDNAMLYFEQLNPAIQKEKMELKKFGNAWTNVFTDQELINFKIILNLEEHPTTHEIQTPYFESSCNLSKLFLIIIESIHQNNQYNHYFTFMKQNEIKSKINQITNEALTTYLYTYYYQQNYNIQLEAYELFQKKYNLYKSQKDQFSKYNLLQMEITKKDLELELHKTLKSKTSQEIKFQQIFGKSDTNLSLPYFEAITLKTPALSNKKKFNQIIKQNNPELNFKKATYHHELLKSKFGILNTIDVKLNLIPPSNIKALKEFSNKGISPFLNSFKSGIPISFHINLSQIIKTISTQGYDLKSAEHDYKYQIVLLNAAIQKYYNRIETAQNEMQIYKELIALTDEFNELNDKQKSLNELSLDKYLEYLQKSLNYKTKYAKTQIELWESYINLLMLAGMLQSRNISAL